MKTVQAVVSRGAADSIKDLGYSKFNGFEHVLINVPREGLTLSCKLPDRKNVTVSFIPYGEDEFECVDVKLHEGPELEAAPMRNAGCIGQKWILFNGGTTTYRTELSEKQCTLATLLLNDRYYQQEEKKEG